MAEQPLHELAVLAMGAEFPPLSFENEANREKILFVEDWHMGHEILSSAWLRERNNSNL